MKNSLLWRISPPSGGPESYLFGTMHVRDMRAFEWLRPAISCLERCEVLATEFDFSETDPVVLAAALQLPDGSTLDQLLKPGVWKNLSFYCRKTLRIPVENFRLHHPMTVSLMLTNALLSEEASASLDETLWEHGRLLGKTTTGVETFEEQLGTLKKIPLDQHLKNLRWLLKNYGCQKRRMKKMLQWYRSGDIRQLYQSAKKDAKGLRKILLYDRNVLMARRFVELSAKQSLFCAVGAGHLAGGRGMLRLLKKKGYKIRPVLPQG